MVRVRVGCLFWNLCGNGFDKNKEIYIFAYLSAIFNLCKLYNHPLKDVVP